MEPAPQAVSGGADVNKVQLPAGSNGGAGYVAGLLPLNAPLLDYLCIIVDDEGSCRIEVGVQAADVKEKAALEAAGGDNIVGGKHDALAGTATAAGAVVLAAVTAAVTAAPSAGQAPCASAAMPNLTLAINLVDSRVEPQPLLQDLLRTSLAVGSNSICDGLHKDAVQATRLALGFGMAVVLPLWPSLVLVWEVLPPVAWHPKFLLLLTMLAIVLAVRAWRARAKLQLLQLRATSLSPSSQGKTGAAKAATLHTCPTASNDMECGLSATRFELHITDRVARAWTCWGVTYTGLQALILCTAIIQSAAIVQELGTYAPLSTLFWCCCGCAVVHLLGMVSAQYWFTREVLVIDGSRWWLSQQLAIGRRRPWITHVVSGQLGDLHTARLESFAQPVGRWTALVGFPAIATGHRLLLEGPAFRRELAVHLSGAGDPDGGDPSRHLWVPGMVNAYLYGLVAPAAEALPGVPTPAADHLSAV